MPGGIFMLRLLHTISQRQRYDKDDLGQDDLDYLDRDLSGVWSVQRSATCSLVARARANYCGDS